MSIWPAGRDDERHFNGRISPFGVMLPADRAYLERLCYGYGPRWASRPELAQLMTRHGRVKYDDFDYGDGDDRVLGGRITHALFGGKDIPRRGRRPSSRPARLGPRSHRINAGPVPAFLFKAVSTGRPSHLPTTQHMQMDVINRLSRVGIAIDHGAIT